MPTESPVRPSEPVPSAAHRRARPLHRRLMPAVAGLVSLALALTACSSAAEGSGGASGPSGASGAPVAGSDTSSPPPSAPSGSSSSAASGAASDSSSPASSSGSSSPGASSGASSGDGSTVSDGIGPDGCVTDYQPGTDYFPEKVTLQDADNFTVTYHDTYAVITVAQPSPGAQPARYVLLRCGTPAPTLPGDLADAQQVTIPVHSLFSGSTTHLPSLVMLDKLDVLTGVASKAYISEKQVLDRVADPDVVEYADAAGTVDAEKVVIAKPDVLITGGTDDPAYAGIEKAGIPVLADADWLETDPLGRAEWLKFFAVLTDTAATATATFDTIVQDYQKLAALVQDEQAVRVVTGQPYQGTWYVPGGGSYTAKLIADAGGTYPWADDDSTGSIATDVETVFAKSGTAPVWLASTTWTTKKQALAENSTFAKFTAFQDGNVWNAAKDVTASGGNNFYELGAARPDLILGDLVAILHPDVLPDHDFAFYLKLT